jgi:SAM-dependent methyltransferase
MDDALQQHYDRQYQAEAGADQPPRTIALSARPKDRFEAAVATLVAETARGGSLLELAAGDGAVARAVLRERPDLGRVVLTEIAQPRIEGLRRVTASLPQVTVTAADAEHLPDFGETFDAVAMVALIEHLVDPLGAMTRLRTIVNPGGFVYLDTPNVAKWTRRLKLIAGRFPSTSSVDEGLVTYDGEPVDLHDEGHLHYFTFRSLSRMLTEFCGYRSVEQVPYFIGSLPVGHHLARLRPQVFSEIALVARV